MNGGNTMFGVGCGDEVHGSVTKARKPAFPNSAGAPQRHDVSTGRSGARLFPLVPALALLLGARPLPAAGSALAQGTTSAAPATLSIENGDRRLVLSRIAPAGPLNGYDVHYTSAKAAVAAGGAPPPAPVRRGRASGRRAANRGPGAGEMPGQACGPAGSRGETREFQHEKPLLVGRKAAGASACPARTSHSEANRCNFKA